MTEGHQLECGQHGFRADVVVGARTRSRLIDVLAGEDAEGDRHRERRRELGEGSRDGVGEDVEVGGLAPNQAAKRHDGVKTTRPGQERNSRRELERPSHLELLYLGAFGKARLHRPFGQGAGHLLVPACPHDRHARPAMEILSPSRSLPRGGHLSQSSPRMRHCSVSE
jgi:hypothetical protein